MLLDTNILIYASKPGGEWLWQWTQHAEAAVSSISKIEALGYRGILTEEEEALQNIFATVPNCAVGDEVILRATQVRRLKKISVTDAIIAATALEYDLPLITRNEADFKNIDGLRVINPFATAPPA